MALVSLVLLGPLSLCRRDVKPYTLLPELTVTRFVKILQFYHFHETLDERRAHTEN